jgi:hypothetical protein
MFLFFPLTSIFLFNTLKVYQTRKKEASTMTKEKLADQLRESINILRTIALSGNWHMHSQGLLSWRGESLEKADEVWWFSDLESVDSSKSVPSSQSLKAPTFPIDYCLVTTIIDSRTLSNETIFQQGRTVLTWTQFMSREEAEEIMRIGYRTPDQTQLMFDIGEPEEISYGGEMSADTPTFLIVTTYLDRTDESIVRRFDDEDEAIYEYSKNVERDYSDSGIEMLLFFELTSEKSGSLRGIGIYSENGRLIPRYLNQELKLV